MSVSRKLLCQDFSGFGKLGREQFIIFLLCLRRLFALCAGVRAQVNCLQVVIVQLESVNVLLLILVFHHIRISVVAELYVLDVWRE